MEMGRQRGGLDIDDIRRALPVDAVSIEELADVLARLEEAGIPVEIDSVLLTSRHPRMTLREVKPSTEPSRHSERTTTAQDRLTILASSIKAARENSSRTPGSARPYVQNSATIFVIAAASILVLLALVVWRFI
jgi:hypothetical protein